MLRIFALFWCCFAFSASAGEKLDYTDTLYFTWARVPLGKLTLTMQQSGTDYTMTTKGKTSGIALLFNRHESTTTVRGTVVAEQRHIPNLYRSDYVDDGDKRLIAIKYDAQGFPAEETIVPPREEIRPLVPQEMKRGAVDILTGFFVMRERLRAALTQLSTPTEQGEARSGGERSVGGLPPSFEVTIYDGKRLFRVDATIDKPLTNVRFHGITRPAVKLALKRLPLQGYKEKELKKLKTRNPVISLYVEPERLVPFGLSVPVYGAKLEAWVKPELKAEKGAKPAL